MSFFEDASLVLIPSAQKTSKVYSVKPTDGTGDLTFTRSNDTATRVGPDGLIEKVRTNLILQSEAFNVTWVPVRSSVTANTTTAPDGTSTADTLFDNTDANLHYVSQSFTAITGPATISVYAKANQLSQIQIVAQGGTAAMGRGFDLSTGTTFAESVGGVTSNDLGQNITAVGDGWYRCTMSWTSTGQTSFWILTSKTNASTYVGTGTDGVFIWGAQLETGDIATDYIATTTAAVSVGPVANVPRLDYLNSSCPRLLLEPQRTNVLLNSETFSSWTNNGTTITSNSVVSPDGYQNADTLTGASGQFRIYQIVSGLSSVDYTFSVFAKKGTATRIYFDFVNVADGPSFNFDTKTWSASAGWSTSYQEYGSGWFRLIATKASNTSSAGLGLSVGAVGETAYIFGAQMEAGSYATSYIPTLGAAVTRGADAASKTGISSLIGQTEGTLYAEFTRLNVGNAVVLFQCNDGTTNNRAQLEIGTSGIATGVVLSGGAVSCVITGATLALGQTHKLALTYKANDFKLYVNGVLAGTDTSGAVPISMSRIDLASELGTSYGGVSVSQILNFTTALTNAQAIELTA